MYLYIKQIEITVSVYEKMRLMYLYIKMRLVYLYIKQIEINVSVYKTN